MNAMNPNRFVRMTFMLKLACLPWQSTTLGLLEYFLVDVKDGISLIMRYMCFKHVNPDIA